MRKSRNTRKVKGKDTLATEVCNHPRFLIAGKRELKKIVKNIQKG